MEDTSTLPRENAPSIPQAVKRLAPSSPQALALKLEAKLDATVNEAHPVDDSREDSGDDDDTASEENSPVHHLPEKEEEDNRDTEKHQMEDDKKDTEKPLMEDDTEKSLDDKDSIKIEINEDNIITVDTNDRPPKKKTSIFVFPITRMKLAWTSSSNTCEFLLKATYIIFSTLGWLFCVGGIPFVSLAMLIMGCVYKDDCKRQPNIPVYLIVAGALGTLQHFIAVWTKYLPKESQGRVRLYRAYCRCFDGLLQLFLMIWFVLGCIWVYGIHSEVDFEDSYKDEYCNKTIYLFAFWILNLSFIVLAILIAFSLCVIICVIGSDKD